MSIQHWHHTDRPRDRLLQHGAESLADAELLAILLNHGTRGKSAVDMARELLEIHRGLRGVFKASAKELCQYHGLGQAKFCQLQASLELCRRHLQESLQQKKQITCAQDAHTFLIASLRDLEQEVFAALFLDSHHHVIQYEKLFYGSIHSTSIHPREVVKRALHHNAAALIIAHNHPSGQLKPSKADMLATKKLKQALTLVDIDLLDHIIVGDTKTLSLADSHPL